MTDGKTLPPEVLAQIIEKTDGVPLFVEEMTKALLESGHLKEVDGHYELIGSFSTFAIPATLQDSLMARLDRLVTAKAVAQYAARPLGVSLRMICSKRSHNWMHHLTTGIGTASRGGDCLPARSATASDLYVQTRPYPGRRVSIPA